MTAIPKVERLSACTPRPTAALVGKLAAGGRGVCAQRTPADGWGVLVTPPHRNTSTCEVLICS